MTKYIKPMAKKNRKVPCIGCAEDVDRSDAEFCLLDGAYCYFCKDCFRNIQKEDAPQGKNPKEKKEPAITEIPKSGWREKTCKEIIADMRKMLEVLGVFKKPSKSSRRTI